MGLLLIKNKRDFQSYQNGKPKLFACFYHFFLSLSQPSSQPSSLFFANHCHHHHHPTNSGIIYVPFRSVSVHSGSLLKILLQLFFTIIVWVIVIFTGFYYIFFMAFGIGVWNDGIIESNVTFEHKLFLFERTKKKTIQFYKHFIE